MTPKEKAEELIKKYLAFSCSGCDMPYCDACTICYYENTASEMALIAVEEILVSHKRMSDIFIRCKDEGSAQCTWLEYNFWQEVKTELLTLTKKYNERR